MALSDNLHDLEDLIGDAMGNALESARRALAEQIHRRSESGLREARERGFRDLREATSKLDAARSQADVLTALLEEGGRFASRTALLLTFADGARGWAAFGFAAEAQGIDDLRLSYDEPALAKLAAGRGAVSLSGDESVAFARHIGGGAPIAGVLVPLVLRDRIAAALYADQLRASDPLVPAALQLLAFTAASLLEAQGARERAATPTLAGVDAAEADGGLPLWDPSAFEAAPSEAPAVAAAAAPAAAAAVAAAAAPTPAPIYAPPPAPPWEEPEVEAAPEPAVEAPTPPAEPPAPEPAVAVERAEAPAPWEELPEEPAWAAPPEAPPAVEEPAPAPPAPPSWQPSWQLEEAPAAATAPEPAAPPEPTVAAEPVPAEEEWVYTDQGYEAEQTYEGAPVAEGAVEEAGFEEDTATYHMGDTGIDATALEPGIDEGVEEVAAVAVEEPMPVEEAIPEDTSPWQTPAAAQPPESTTSPLYGGPLYPSEATVRISRDLLQGAAAPAPPAPAFAAPDVSEDSTVMLQRPTLPAPPPAPAPTPAPVEPPRPAAPRPAAVFGGGGGGTTEVQPPPDLEGPGWAFRGGEASTASYRQQTEENSALHEEARRLARLLVSEIKLYNEEQIEEGRRQRDIYPRLQEDIDRSRQMYEERVDAKVREEVDYFQQEMVNILAGGDAGALGM
jgi:hypothetical protein